jgi:hypothetical protein
VSHVFCVRRVQASPDDALTRHLMTQQGQGRGRGGDVYVASKDLGAGLGVAYLRHALVALPAPETHWVLTRTESEVTANWLSLNY